MSHEINFYGEDGAATKFGQAKAALENNTVKDRPAVALEAAIAIDRANYHISEARKSGTNPHLRLVDAFGQTYNVPVTAETRIARDGKLFSHLPEQAKWGSQGATLGNVGAVVTDRPFTFIH